MNVQNGRWQARCLAPQAHQHYLGSSVRLPAACPSTARVSRRGPVVVSVQSPVQTTTTSTTTQPPPPQARHKAPARSKEDLNDPVQIGATGKSSFTVKDYPGSVDLTAYMLLPVEQYFVLDPKQIRHLGGNRFLLLVPRINVFNIWLEPEVEISVQTQAHPPRVVLKAENCRIKGSEWIQSWRLDERFCMQFTTTLTWASQPYDQQAAAAAAAQSAKQSKSLFSLGSSPSSPSSGSPADPPPLLPVGTGVISGDAVLDVWCEVIPPFHLMPRSALQSTCNAVMRGLVSTLLPLFLRKLGTDYQRWAVQPAYRQERAQRSKPLAAALPEQ